jgi:hypothetical protein
MGTPDEPDLDARSTLKGLFSATIIILIIYQQITNR